VVQRLATTRGVVGTCSGGRGNASRNRRGPTLSREEAVARREAVLGEGVVGAGRRGRIGQAAEGGGVAVGEEEERVVGLSVGLDEMGRGGIDPTGAVVAAGGVAGAVGPGARLPPIETKTAGMQVGFSGPP
jgi:hypothetical protein